MMAGDYAFNVATGECKLVIGYDASRNEVTFSGETRWVSAKHWRTNVSPPKRSVERG
jgi:hypothetical protein